MSPRRALTLFLVFAAALTAQSPVPSPKEVLGFEPGTDGQLADYGQILGYFARLAEASDRVDLRVVGKSTQGRDMALAAISSPENLRRLEALRQDNARLADPRTLSQLEGEAIVRRGKVFVLVNESIHSNEVGPAQASMVTAHFLATTTDPAWRAVLDDVVVLLNPCHNPDGYDATVGWWRQTSSDPKTRGAPMPWLYHQYVGHDNNRDWFMLTQQESRVTVAEMHLRWHPQIVVDQHQMGGSGARMFIPPYQDPWEPNVHPLLKKQLDSLGRSVVAAMTAEGLGGVVCNRLFDAWSPARAFMHYHGGVRVLTEVASAAVADPIDSPKPRRAPEISADDPAPWPGGRWTLGDIVRYSSRGALLAIKHGSDQRETWLRSFLTIHRDACRNEGLPRGYVIPCPQPRTAAIRKLVDLLTLGGVEIHRSDEDAMLGTTFCPRRSLVVRGDQPYFPWVRALFERTPYPEIRTRPDGPIRRPYDVTAHCLPLLLDVTVMPVAEGPLPSATERVDAASFAIDDRVMGDILLDPRDDGSYADALRALAAGAPVERLSTALGSVPAGAFILRSKGEVRLAHARALPVPPGAKGERLSSPRIAIYSPWTASMDEGWTRFLFDSFGIPFVRLTNADLKKGELGAKIDVLVIPDLTRASILEGQRSEKLPERYRGGIGNEGEAAVKAFVNEGGTLVCMGASAAFGIQALAIPAKTLPERGRTLYSSPEAAADPVRGEGTPPEAGAGAEAGRRPPPPPEGSEVAGEGRGARREERPDERFDIPGAILRATPDPKHPVAFGCSEELPVFFEQDKAFAPTLENGFPETVSIPLRYAGTSPVLVGFQEGVEKIAGAPAVLAAKVGKGHAVLFGFSPQFRTQTHATFRLFFNSLLLGRGAE